MSEQISDDELELELDKLGDFLMGGEPEPVSDLTMARWRKALEQEAAKPTVGWAGPLATASVPAGALAIAYASVLTPVSALLLLTAVGVYGVRLRSTIERR